MRLFRTLIKVRPFLRGNQQRLRQTSAANCYVLVGSIVVPKEGEKNETDLCLLVAESTDTDEESQP